MQSDIFQAFICYIFDDYGLQLKNFSQYSNFEFMVFIRVFVSHNHQNYEF